MEHEELTGRIIRSAIAVHKELGPGFLESIYEAALVKALSDDGLIIEKQKEIPVFFRGFQVGTHRLDLLVENTIVIELKAIKALEDIHFAQVRSYLKATNLRHGLLFNFNEIPLKTKRVICD